MPLGMEIDLGQGDFVLDDDPAPPPQKGADTPHQFLADVYCGQTARWIKTALGVAVGLDPGHIVLDGDPASFPPQKKGEPPRNVRPMSIVAKRLYVSGYYLVQR